MGTGVGSGLTDAARDAFMREALAEARRAADAGEVPIGAVLTVDDVIVARGYNRPISSLDPTAHAEICVLRDAARALGNYRLVGATLFVTVEPCLMCVGALVHARVRQVVYGAVEPKTGALVSAVAALALPGLNHTFDVVGGVCEEECRALMQEFFKARR